MTTIDPWNADYSSLDPCLLGWAEKNGIQVELEAKGYPFRCFWISSKNGRAQVWIDPPNDSGVATLHAAELDLSKASKWARKLDLEVNVDSLETCLDEALATGRSWARHQQDETLHRELWTSWASMLRVYAAAHGLTSTQHAVVEVGAEEIVLRVGPKWMRFSPDQMRSSEGASLPFSLEEDGRVRIGDVEDEMDMAAERVAREMLAG